MTMTIRLLLATWLVAGTGIVVADESGPGAIAARIDSFLEEHWKRQDITPSPRADDATFLRRVTLDLTGRIPTYDEARSFAQAKSQDGKEKWSRLVRRLLERPEHNLHLGTVLDEIIQGKYAGDAEFRAYLRSAVKEGRAWDQVFREIILGPWDTPERARANRFLKRRVRSLDELTTNTAKVFFGVDISCAKCHDHPLVFDWSQDHYYGMTAFFNRTYEHKDGKKKLLGEKSDGEVTFVVKDGDKKTAKMKFLSGLVVEDLKPDDEKGGKEKTQGKKRSRQNGPYTPPAFSRREQLVKVALENKTFFSRSLVNRLWAYFMGRGIVEPVDQLHSENPPSVDGLLEWLAADFAAAGYDIRRLVEGIALSRAYGLASTWEGEGEPPEDKHFAVAMVKPLSPEQYAASLVLASGKEALGSEAPDTPARDHGDEEKRALELVRAAASLTRHGVLDAPAADFQSSVTEALFMSNHPDVQKLVEPGGGNLVETLSVFSATGELVDAAFWVVLSRPSTAEEREHLVEWLDRTEGSRAQAVRDLAWALFTSAEFRFNH